MPPGMWFWIVYVICVVVGCILGWPREPEPNRSWRPFGVTVIIFVLLGLLGWGTFGPPIR